MAKDETTRVLLVDRERRRLGVLTLDREVSLPELAQALHRFHVQVGPVVGEDGKPVPTPPPAPKAKPADAKGKGSASA